jgi:hypothetical protein
MKFGNFPKIFPVLALLLYSCSSVAEPDWVLDFERSLENRLLARLELAQQGARLNAFTTDGCSGGMSEGWAFLARALPRFAEKFGERPVWEDCCVTHDRSYWRGESAQGFNRRLSADDELRRCVREYGPRLAPELGARHGLSEETVIAIFSTAGEIMHQAVRVGGKPCTFLPWRWGYGWPQCPVFASENESKK